MTLSFPTGMTRFSCRSRPLLVSSFTGSAHTIPTQIHLIFLSVNCAAQATHFTSFASEPGFASMLRSYPPVFYIFLNKVSTPHQSPKPHRLESFSFDFTGFSPKEYFSQNLPFSTGPKAYFGNQSNLSNFFSFSH